MPSLADHTLVLILAGVGLGVGYVGSLIWVYRDARRHGHPPWKAVVFVVILVWPLSLFIWILLRSQRAIGHKDGGTAWG